MLAQAVMLSRWERFAILIGCAVLIYVLIAVRP